MRSSHRRFSHAPDSRTERARGPVRAGAMMLLALLIAGAPSPAFSASARGESAQAARLQPLHEFLSARTASGGYTGAVSLIAVDGTILEQRAYGHADLARTRPMRIDSIFRIYSMTKPITSVAAMMLLEEGRIGLDDPVDRYLPEFAGIQCLCGDAGAAAATKPPTVRHLLTHTAGFATDAGENAQAHAALQAAAPEQAADLDDYVRRVARAPLAEKPGTHFHYDGVNTQVLARLIEVVSGQPLDQFLHARIFTPLRMRDTGFEVAASERARIVDLTTTIDGQRVIADTASARAPGMRVTAYLNGAGGLYSTAGDYFRFAQMLAHDGELEGVRLLSRKSVDLMMRDQLEAMSPGMKGPGPGEGFGLGGYVVTDVARRGRLGSNGQFGWSGAASTYFTIDRQEHLVALLLAQHLPTDGPGELPRLSVPYFNLVYRALP